MRHLAVSAAFLGLSVSAGAATAQQRDLPKPQDHPVIRLKDPEQKTVEIQVTLSAHTRNVQTNDGGYGSSYLVHQWDIDSMVVVLPTITTTGSAIAVPDSVRGQLFVDGRELDNTPTIIGPYQGQTMYARYEAGPVRADGFRVRQQQDVISYETVYDEDLAKQLPWPDAWPPEADSTFQPQQLVSELRSAYDNEGPVNDLVRLWTNNEDPTKIPPAELAKYLTKRVWDHVRIVRPTISNVPSDDGLVISARVDGGTDSRYGGGQVRQQDVGYYVQHADDTATTGEGSENDMAILLTAVMRAAGLPARLVIGYREESEDIQELSSSDRNRTWVEFALFDPSANEGKGQLLWIPVDIVELKQSSSRSRNLNRPWKYFGTNDELDTLIPVSHHFHPPTTVRSYTVPALYGWTTDPAPPEIASQGFVLNISGTAVRGDDQQTQQPPPTRRGRRGRP
ncbi:MAG: transglutaminase domain-containing protein [Phycisphaerales bacterium]